MTRPTRKRWMADLTTLGGAAGARPLARVRSDRDSSSRFTVQGLGLTSARLRERMVERLQASGIRDASVLDAMRRVARHSFVDQGFASRAYEDESLPIGHEQTISQPYVVARMTELVCAGGNGGRVLEIGTGCGYQSAVLAAVAVEVYSIERIRALHERARQNLRPLRLSNVRLVYGDGLQGLPEAAPFDAMLVAAAASSLPLTLLCQLRVGGVAIAPIGGGGQALCRITRTAAENFSHEVLEPVHFVPLLSGLA